MKIDTPDLKKKADTVIESVDTFEFCITTNKHLE